MDERILEQLSQPFAVKERKGVGNKIFKYVPTEDIVDRMNKAFKGNWSTEVKNSEIIEDQILMCVRVYVQDPTNSDAKMLWHDGYASHPLTRYTSGPNNGKIIDVGNSYKSAMSKAIKTAVAKWGVALYLDQDDAPTTAASTTTPIPTNIPVEPKKEEKPVVTGPPVGGPPMGGTPSGGSPSGGTPIGGPPMDNPVVSNTSQPPVFTVENTEAPGGSTDFDMPAGIDNGGGEKLTPVQKVAIETLMSVNNLTFEELLSKSLMRENDLPASLDDISYLDAVTIIQYGNNLRNV